MKLRTVKYFRWQSILSGVHKGSKKIRQFNGFQMKGINDKRSDGCSSPLLQPTRFFLTIHRYIYHAILVSNERYPRVEFNFGYITRINLTFSQLPPICDIVTFIRQYEYQIKGLGKLLSSSLCLWPPYIS